MPARVCRGIIAPMNALVISVVLAAGSLVACAHSSPSRQESTETETSAAGRGRSDVASDAAITPDPSPAAASLVVPLTFAGACVPNVLRLPVRADIEPGRTPNVDRVVFSRPLCITSHGESLCHVQPAVIVDQGGRAFHGAGVGVVSVINSDPAHLTVSLEKFDETISLAQAFAFTETDSVVEDGCVTIPWSSEGLGTLRNVRGDVTRADPSGPWMFRPSPRLCASTHVPGDDRVFDAPLPMTGKGATGIPKPGLFGAHINGTLRGPTATARSKGFVQGAFSVEADGVTKALEWHLGGR